MYSNFSPLLIPAPLNLNSGFNNPPFFSGLAMYLKGQKPSQFSDGSWGYIDYAGKDDRSLRGGFCLEGNGVLTVNFTEALANTEMTYFNGTTDVTFTTNAIGKWTPANGVRFYNIRQLSVSGNVVRQWIVNEEKGNLLYCSTSNQINASLEGEAPSNWVADQRFESFSDRFGYTNDNGVIVPLIYSEYLNPTKIDAQGNDAEFTGQAKIPVKTLSPVAYFDKTLYGAYIDLDETIYITAGSKITIRAKVNDQTRGGFYNDKIPAVRNYSRFNTDKRFRIENNLNEGVTFDTSSIDLTDDFHIIEIDFDENNTNVRLHVDGRLVGEGSWTSSYTIIRNICAAYSVTTFDGLVDYFEIQTPNKTYRYDFSEGAGGIVYDVVEGTEAHPAINGTITRANLTPDQLDSFWQKSSEVEPIGMINGVTKDGDVDIPAQIDADGNLTGKDALGNTLTNPAGAFHNGANVDLLIDEKASGIASVENIQGFEFWFDSSQNPRKVGYDQKNYDVFDEGTQYHTNFSNAEDKKWRDQIVYRTPKTGNDLIKVSKFIKYD